MEERIRVHLWRVHASSFLALVASQIFVAGFLYFVQPDLTSRKVQRQVKRHQSTAGEGHQGAVERPSPHTMWTRLDLLIGDKRLRPSPAERKQREATRDLRLQLYRQEKLVELDHLRSRANQAFNGLASVS